MALLHLRSCITLLMILAIVPACDAKKLMNTLTTSGSFLTKDASFTTPDAIAKAKFDGAWRGGGSSPDRGRKLQETCTSSCTPGLFAPFCWSQSLGIPYNATAPAYVCPGGADGTEPLTGCMETCTTDDLPHLKSVFDNFYCWSNTNREFNFDAGWLWSSSCPLFEGVVSKKAADNCWSSCTGCPEGDACPDTLADTCLGPCVENAGDLTSPLNGFMIASGVMQGFQCFVGDTDAEFRNCPVIADHIPATPCAQEAYAELSYGLSCLPPLQDGTISYRTSLYAACPASQFLGAFDTPMQYAACMNKTAYAAVHEMPLGADVGSYAANSCQYSSEMSGPMTNVYYSDDECKVPIFKQPTQPFPQDCGPCFYDTSLPTPWDVVKALDDLPACLQTCPGFTPEVNQAFVDFIKLSSENVMTLRNFLALDSTATCTLACCMTSAAPDQKTGFDNLMDVFLLPKVFATATDTTSPTPYTCPTFSPTFSPTAPTTSPTTTSPTASPTTASPTNPSSTLTEGTTVPPSSKSAITAASTSAASAASTSGLVAAALAAGALLLAA